ncbi:hypothetical protein EVAR_87665_1 [Eumeta japonica]|uniref:Uncharacterized protein n=1 Tax=Eumeta variegata TaxID=151549 RepID=A0A4C1WI56_EUMVA|nr:hypothetical protein EVAR_87665_1 [Eumeta japonica]
MHARTQSCTQARTHARKHARKQARKHARTYGLALKRPLPNERWNSTCLENVSYLNADLGYSASSAFKVVTPTYRLTRGGLRKRMCLASRFRRMQQATTKARVKSCSGADAAALKLRFEK